ncbi:chromatin remodelling complex Rsc7/Swp82 subunit-domain-containing protein [Pilobolus umbonatus]|nr:chromatin remodelling complex Rsc7/Swp82 subunit-domain-containing protein [Pilobolus umbonatus]
MASGENRHKKGKELTMPKKISTRSTTHTERSTKKVEEVRSSGRKRGRPSNYYSSSLDDGNDAKRKREKSPEFEANSEEEASLTDNEEDGAMTSDIEEEGETKVDRHGNLLGGRRYKVPTFTLPGHGDQQYMLATDATKCLGFRDSYLFFLRNPSLKRVRVTDKEKDILTDMGILVTWFKNRDVNLVPARSVFQRFGHRIVEKGRRLKDDYYSSDRKTTHDTRRERRESSKAHRKDEVEEDKEEVENKEKNTRQSLIRKTSRSEGYASEVPTDKKTWIHHAALATRGFNAQLNERRASKRSFYDIHTHINQVPLLCQPTSCRVELVKGGNHEAAPIISFEKKQTIQGPLFRGVGQDILDYDHQLALEALSETERDKAKHILDTPPSYIKEIKPDDDERYPLSVMEGQHQTTFPIHQARFNYPIPKIPQPTALSDTAQSLTAQQYYLGLVYQSVNPYVDPQRQIPARPPQYTMPPQPIPRQPIQSPHLCGAMMPNNQPCKRAVNAIGEKCSLHVPKAVAPPVQITQPSHSENRCADCHQLRVDDSLFAAGDKRVIDDYALVKCSKCGKKYHPICANLTTSQQVTVVESYPWSCPDCKTCCKCNTVGDESTLMICDGCDRGWHTTCCTPKVDKVPDGSWLCPVCAKCRSCDVHGIKEEYEHAIAPETDRYKYSVYLATYCHPCYANFLDDRFCPVCLKTYSDEDNDDEDNEMVACDSCDHWIHTRCDEYLTPSKYQKLCDDEDAKYSCPMCEDRIKRTVDTSSADLALKGLSAPCGYSVGLLGGKVKTRGVIKYKEIKVGVPEINGSVHP